MSCGRLSFTQCCSEAYLITSSALRPLCWKLKVDVILNLFQNLVRDPEMNPG
jgi:hypothetical protein